MAFILNGTATTDTLPGSSVNDFIYGNNGADWIIGGDGNDVLYGGSGRDTLDGGAGNDTLIGGSGDDVLVYDPTDIVVRGNEGTDWLVADTLVSSATISLTSFADIENLAAGGNHVTLQGNSGSNTIVGRGTGDSIDGDSGNDWLYGAGSTATLLGGAGNDILIFNPDNDPVNIQGGAGLDKLDASWMRTGAAIALADYVHNDIEALIGGYGADTLAGNLLDNTLAGGDGNDLLDGLSGNDILYGGYGNDTLSGGTGNDTLIGGSGADVFLFGTGDGNDTLFAADGNDWVSFGAGWTSDNLYAYRTAGNELVVSCADAADLLVVDDYFSANEYLHFAQADGKELSLTETSAGIYSFSGADHIFGTTGADAIAVAIDYGALVRVFSGNDTVTGGKGGDTLYGDAGNDWLLGGNGSDILYGGNDNDYLSGNDGNDLLYGGKGNDTLAAGGGYDTLYGESGNDVFLLWNGCGQALIAGSPNDSLDIRETERSFMGYTFNNFFINTTDDQADHCPEAVFAGNDLWLDFAVYGTVVLDNYAIGNAYQVQAVQIHNDTGGEVFGGVLGVGTAGNDSIQLSSNDSMFFGLEGNDSIIGGNKQNYLVGGEGDDTLGVKPTSSRNVLLGGDGNDYITGGGSFDILVGGDGNDILAGGSTASGIDVYRFAGGWGNDVINDSAGTNCVDFTDLQVSDVQAAVNGATLTITYGDDAVQILSGYTSYYFRFGIADAQGFNKYTYSNGAFHIFSV